MGVEPTRSQNMTVKGRRSPAGAVRGWAIARARAAPHLPQYFMPPGLAYAQLGQAMRGGTAGPIIRAERKCLPAARATQAGVGTCVASS